MNFFPQQLFQQSYMEWLNIKIATLRAPEYIGSKPVERATWINVFAYSCEQENGGRLAGAASWKDRQWQQACGVTSREVRAADKLLRVEGDDVLVYAYPLEKQAEVQARRIQAGDAARRRWGDRLGIAPRTAQPDAPRIPPRNAEGEGERESVVVSADAREHAAEPPAPRPHHDKLVEFSDLEKLQTQFPLVDVAREREKALAYAREKRGPAAELELRFFAEDWLPKAPVRSEAQQARAERQAEAAGEPKGWQAWMDANFPDWVYATGRDPGPRKWGEHTALTQKFVIDTMKKGGAK